MPVLCLCWACVASMLGLYRAFVAPVPNLCRTRAGPVPCLCSFCVVPESYLYCACRTYAGLAPCLCRTCAGPVPCLCWACLAPVPGLRVSVSCLWPTGAAPVPAALPCQLTCRPVGQHFTAVLSDTVVDGTPCQLDSDICINGKCRVRQLMVRRACSRR